MKDPVSVLGCWRGFSQRAHRAKLQTAQTIILFFVALKPPDLPIKMPDLDITAVYKLASGLQGLRVCFGLDRFVYDATRSSPSIKPDTSAWRPPPFPEITAGGMELEGGSHAGTEWNQRACGGRLNGNY